MIWRIVPVSYWAVVAFIRLCLFLYVKGPAVEGRENVPRSGGAIIVSNHMNNADPCVLPGVMPRRIVFMAKKEWFGHPLGALLFRLIGAFPVDRQSADIGALREATRVVNDGLPLLMFPEGTRSKDHQLHQGFPGTALVAHRTAAPIIPVAITGTEHIPWPWVFVRPFVGPRVVVRIGKPFYLAKTERMTSRAAKEATDDIMRHIAELLPEQYRGVYRDAVAEHSSPEEGDPVSTRSTP